MIASPNQVAYATKYRNIRSHVYRNRMRYVGASVFFAVLLAATGVSASAGSARRPRPHYLQPFDPKARIAARAKLAASAKLKKKTKNKRTPAEQEAFFLETNKRHEARMAAKNKAKAERRRGGHHLDRAAIRFPEEFDQISRMKLYQRKLDLKNSEIRIDYYLEGQHEAVGRLKGEVNENEDLAKIGSVAVHADWQGTAIYKRLYNAFILYANTMLGGSLKEVRLEAAGGFMSHYSYGFRTYEFKRPYAGEPWAKFQYTNTSGVDYTTSHFSEKLNLAMTDCKALPRSERCSLKEFLRRKVENGEAENVPRQIDDFHGDCIWFKMKLQDPLTNPVSVIVKKQYSLAGTEPQFLLNCGIDGSSISLVLQVDERAETGFRMNNIEFRRRLAALPGRYTRAHPVNPASRPVDAHDATKP